MIDTLKISLEVTPSIFLDNKNFHKFSSKYIQGNKTLRKLVINHTNQDKYFPRLTFYIRNYKGSTSYQLFVEFSAPKLLLGNNFDELSDDHFNPLVSCLQQKLEIMTGCSFAVESLKEAPVSVCHYSKNFIFQDYTSCLTILDALAKQDISGIYDAQTTKYRIGHALQIHTNSLDISFYDKVKELQQTNISPKRSIESHALKQEKLLNHLVANKPFDVLRYEVRLANRTKIKRLLPDLNNWDFQSLFSTSLSQMVLQHHWKLFIKNTDFLSLDPSKPMEIFQNYLTQDPTISINDALKATASILIVNQSGFRPLQQLVSKRSGQHSWYRLKPIIRSPEAHRYKSFQKISKDLNSFSPIRLPPQIRVEEKHL